MIVVFHLRDPAGCGEASGVLHNRGPLNLTCAFLLMVAAPGSYLMTSNHFERLQLPLARPWAIAVDSHPTLLLPGYPISRLFLDAS